MGSLESCGKGTKRQFDITELPKLSGIADVDIAATLFTYDIASIFETAAQSLFYVAYAFLEEANEEKMLNKDGQKFHMCRKSARCGSCS
ncbi:Gamma-tubulin complex component [Trichinella pseudospiralis]